MTDRTIAYIALVVALVALAWAVVHSFVADQANGGPAHVRGLRNENLPSWMRRETAIAQAIEPTPAAPVVLRPAVTADPALFATMATAPTYSVVG